MSEQTSQQETTLFGHPTGLYTLFFAEMWERFSYYGMRALLVLYMTKGFLGYGDKEAYKIYGAYVALVYMTPFFGGMLADRLLGARRAVVLGGVLMALGHLMMTGENDYAFYSALALLIVGNGFFKPNISTIVGSLYGDNDSRRDGGFTIFYMGINLGAAMAPLLCGAVGEIYGWHYGFGLATIGMMMGLAVFVVPNRVSQVVILGGAVVTAIGMVYQSTELASYVFAVNLLVAIALVVSGGAAFLALGRGGLPPEAGGAPDPEALKRPVLGPITAEWAVYLGSLALIPVLSLMVWSNRHITLVPDSFIQSMEGHWFTEIGAVLLAEVSTPTGLVLTVTGLIAVIYLMREALAAEKVERERLFVVLTLMFFSMLFWALFEQAGSSINLFTDRNVDRVTASDVIRADQVGQTIEITMNQEQLGYANGDQMMTVTSLDEARKKKALTVQWTIDADDVGMGVGGEVVPATVFQSANPVFIILFALPFSWLWVKLGQAGKEPSTPAKFALGLLQLGLGFGALWYGSVNCDPRGMVGVTWLLLGYLLHTTGELCLSPVGLSMVTKLSPKRLVSTAMGAWFLATAFSGFLAAIIAGFTGISHGGGESEGIPVPIETVHIYGDVFGQIAVAALISAALMAVLTPKLKTWMHEEA